MRDWRGVALQKRSVDKALLDTRGRSAHCQQGMWVATTAGERARTKAEEQVRPFRSYDRSPKLGAHRHQQPRQIARAASSRELGTLGGDIYGYTNACRNLVQLRNEYKSLYLNPPTYNHESGVDWEARYFLGRITRRLSYFQCLLTPFKPSVSRPVRHSVFTSAQLATFP